MPEKLPGVCEAQACDLEAANLGFLLTELSLSPIGQLISNKPKSYCASSFARIYMLIRLCDRDTVRAVTRAGLHIYDTVISYSEWLIVPLGIAENFTPPSKMHVE